MQIVVAASDEQWNELTESRTEIDWIRVDDTTAFNQYKDADAFFSLKDNSFSTEFKTLSKPVFINSVVQTLTELEASPNIYRINGWATFFKPFGLGN